MSVFTDEEYRILLSAMERESRVCRMVDEESKGNSDTVDLESVCSSIWKKLHDIQYRQYKNEIHDLRKNAGDVPRYMRYVICFVAGSDVIRCNPGETLEEAIDRITKDVRTTVGYYSSEDGWCSAENYPMIVRPIAWMELPRWEDVNG